MVHSLSSSLSHSLTLSLDNDWSADECSMHCVVSGVAPRRYSVKLWAEEDQDRDFSFWIPDASRQATHRIVVEYADAMAMPKALLNQLKRVRIPDGSSINNTHSGGNFFSG